MYRPTAPAASPRSRPPGIPPRLSKSPGRFYDICRLAWVAIFRLTMRTKISGPLDLAENGGLLVAVSHVGHLDPIVVSAVLRRRIGWVSRVEFYKIWFMRQVLHRGGAFQVDRGGRALPTIREGLRRLARGEAVGIFPEGNVMRGAGSVLRGAGIKHGVCVLAARSGTPVLPVVVLGTDRLARVGPWLPAKRGRLWVRVGRPLHAASDGHTRRGRAEFAAILAAEYVRLYGEMRAEHGLPEAIVP